jgi:hypothetical protein
VLVGSSFEFLRPSGKRRRIGTGDPLEQLWAVTQESGDHGLAREHTSQPAEHVSIQTRCGGVFRPPFEERRRGCFEARLEDAAPNYIEKSIF